MHWRTRDARFSPSEAFVPISRAAAREFKIIGEPSRIGGVQQSSMVCRPEATLLNRVLNGVKQTKLNYVWNAHCFERPPSKRSLQGPNHEAKKYLQEKHRLMLSYIRHGARELLSMADGFLEIGLQRQASTGVCRGYSTTLFYNFCFLNLHAPAKQSLQVYNCGQH